jgi:hypothetical protein
MELDKLSTLREAKELFVRKTLSLQKVAVTASE